MCADRFFSSFACVAISHPFYFLKNEAYLLEFSLNYLFKFLLKKELL